MNAEWYKPYLKETVIKDNEGELDEQLRTEESIQKLGMSEKEICKKYGIEYSEHTNSPKFHETHKRITTYLENDVHTIVHILLKQKRITSISEFINSSVQNELRRSMNI